jgi:predicted metal-dependent hydrolase
MNIDRIIRSQRKTIAIIIQKDGKIIIRAPKRATNAQIQNFIEMKAHWIETKQTEALQRVAQKKKKLYIQGETFLYLGTAYPLEIVDQAQSPLALFDGCFLLARSAHSNAKELFTSWYKQQAHIVMSERVRLYASQYQLSYQKTRISSARTRWGSCSTSGTISFTWRLVMAPISVIDYVVIHELAHIVEDNHSHRFWEKIGAMMPDYAKHKQWLKTNGFQLTLD